MFNIVNYLKKNKNEICLYCVIFCLMMLLARANVMGVKIPLASAFAFSFILFDKNVVIVGLSFIFGCLINDLSFQSLVISINVVSVLILLYLIYKTANKKPSLFSCFVGCVFSLVGYLYYHLTSPINIIITLVLIIITLMFLYICTQVLNAVLKRGALSRFTTDEVICISIFLIALFSGLSNIYLYYINITSIIAVFMVLSASRVLKKSQTLNLALLMGIGISIGEGTVVNIAVYVTMAMIAELFKDKHKLLSAVSVFMVDLVFGYFFSVYIYYSYVNILSVLVACLIYVVIPYRFFNIVGLNVCDYEGSLANEFVICGQKDDLKKRITRISELFYNIHNILNDLSLRAMSKEDAVKVLTQDLRHKYCSLCSKNKECEENKKINDSINQLFEFGVERGKITIIDANNLITQECDRLTGLINEVNYRVELFRDYERTVKNQESNKLLLSQHFIGTSMIMKEIADFVIYGEKINYTASKVLLDELTLNNIITSEAMVLENEQGIARIVLVVKNQDVLSENIVLTIRTVFKIKFAVDTRKMTRFSGWSVISLSPSPKYDISVGFACSSKEQGAVSGDTYSFTNLDNNKVLIAICDGMGHGDKANEISSMALDLIENFYKAGFSSEIVFESINNLLLTANDERFTTLDVCVFDKNNATADFIKIGAVCSVVKSGNLSRLVTSDSLPLGVVDNIAVSSKKCILKDKDMIIMASDGIVDSFYNNEEYLNYVNNESAVNVQMLASNILEEAECREVEHKDDKTIIVFKVCKKD